MSEGPHGEEHPLAEFGQRLAQRLTSGNVSCGGKTDGHGRTTAPERRTHDRRSPSIALPPEIAAIGNRSGKVTIVIEAPGKIPAMKRIAARAGMDARIIATGGHIMRNPASLFPCGIHRDPETGKMIEPDRRISDHGLRNFAPSLAMAVAEGLPVIIATDPDMEGDVIADDVLTLMREVGRRISVRPMAWRMRMQGLTYVSFCQALAGIHRLNPLDAMRMAAPGRARAALDRIISSTWTQPGAPVGRVMTPLLAMIGSGSAGQECGEIRLAAAAADGGRPFMAILPIRHGRSHAGTGYPDEAPPDEDSDEDRIRTDLAMKIAHRFRGHFVPGYVRRLQGVGAAVTARFGPVPCHATEDILIAASRQTGMPVVRAERALQRLYQKGEISYPRTDERGLTPATAQSLTALARNMGVTDFDPHAAASAAPAPVNHQGLHPIIQHDGDSDPQPGSPSGRQSASRMAERALQALDMKIISSHIDSPARDAADDQAIFALIARRAVEAGIDRDLQRGQWVDFDGVDDHAAGLSDEEVDLLENLDWFRESGHSLPWSRIEETGVSTWPLDGQIVHAATLLKLGRPSTLASQADALLRNRFIQLGNHPGGEPDDPARIPIRAIGSEAATSRAMTIEAMTPALTPAGHGAVTGAPAGLRKPIFAHIADTVISTAGDGWPAPLAPARRADSRTSPEEEAEDEDTGAAEYPVPEWADLTGAAFSRFTEALRSHSMSPLAEEMKNLVDTGADRRPPFSIDLLFRDPALHRIAGNQPWREGLKAQYDQGSAIHMHAIADHSGPQAGDHARASPLPDLDGLATFVALHRSESSPHTSRQSIAAGDLHLDLLRMARWIGDLPRHRNFRLSAPGPDAGDGIDRPSPHDKLLSMPASTSIVARLRVETITLSDTVPADMIEVSCSGGPSGIHAPADSGQETQLAIERWLVHEREQATDRSSDRNNDRSDETGRRRRAKEQIVWVIRVADDEASANDAISDDAMNDAAPAVSAPSAILGVLKNGRLAIAPHLRLRGLAARLALTAAAWEAALLVIADDAAPPHDSAAGGLFYPLRLPAPILSEQGIKAASLCMEIADRLSDLARLLERNARVLAEIAEDPRQVVRNHPARFPWATIMAQDGNEPSGEGPGSAYRFDLDISRITGLRRQDGGNDAWLSSQYPDRQEGDSRFANESDQREIASD